MQLARLPYKIKRGLDVYTRLYLRHQIPVLIYTTGRVGSMALHYSLEQTDVFAFQVHTFNPVKLIENQQPGTAVWAYRHIIKPRRAAQIITIVRDPLAVMVSDFFPKLRWITGHQDAYKRYSVDQLCDIFNERYFGEGRHLEKLNWFENEMQASLNISVYDHPFDPEIGWSRFEQSPYQILVLKTELDDSVKSDIVADFLGLARFTVTRRNVGETKEYGEVYRDFKKHLRVLPQHLDSVYQSRLARHFYTPAEIDTFCKQWGKTIPDQESAIS